MAAPPLTMDRKRPRPGESTADILRLLASSRCTGSALSDILRKLKLHSDRIEDLPASRYAIQSAVLDLFDTVSVSETIQLTDGSEFTWEYIDPAMLLSETVRRLPSVAATYESAMLKHPPSEARPWHLIVGHRMRRNFI